MQTPVAPTIESQLRTACAELDATLRTEKPISASDLLRKYPDLAADKDAALELVYTEFIIRSELGQQPTADRWIAQFPQWRDDLHDLFGIHDLLHEAPEPGGLDIEDRHTEFFRNEDSSETDGSRGRWLGQYEVLKELGHGGMGVVYQARQRGLGRIVSLKVIRSWSSASAAELIRFRTEAEATARLQHPNIVQIYEVSEHEGCPFLAMEFVDGGNLEETFGDTAIPAGRAATLVETLARAAHFAHQRGVVHRDLKPSNVLLQRRSDGQTPESNLVVGEASLVPKISDFGLAKLVRAENAADASTNRRAGVTHHGDALGTPSFMAPEQASGQTDSIGPASDVYALGAILYKLVTGRLPFQGVTTLETLEQVRSQDPLPPRRLQADVPRDIETICLKCLEKSPSQRYASAAALADDLRRFLDGEPIRARPIATWERAAKWARRRPALATMLAMVVSVSVVAFVAVTWAWRRADRSRVAAEKSQVAAIAAFGKAEAARAKEQTERQRVENSLYFHNIALAYHEYLNNDLARANQLLAACRPDRRHWEWNYLHRICNRQLLTLSELSLSVRCLVYSPDGRHIAAGSGQQHSPIRAEVKVWDATTGKELFTFREQPGAIQSLAFSPDGNTLASVSLSWSRPLRGDVRLWDLVTGRVRVAIPSDIEALNITFSPDGRRLALGCRRGIIRICDSFTGTEQRRITGHRRDVLGVCFSPDGSRFASASEDGSVRVWDAVDGHQLLVLPDPTGRMSYRNVRFSPDGSHIAAVALGGTVKLFDALSGSEIATHQVHADATQITYRLGDQWPTSVTTQNGILDLQALTDKPIQGVSSQRADSMLAEFSADGRRLATCTTDRRVKVWDMTRSPEPKTIRVTGGGDATEMAFSPDSEQLAVLTSPRVGGNNRASPADKTLRLWDLAGKRPLRVLKGHTDWLNCVAFSPDGQIIATGSVDKTVRLWNAQSGDLLDSLTGHSGRVRSIAFQPHGREMMIASTLRNLWIWNATTGKLDANLKAHESGITNIAYASDGRHVAVAGANGDTKIWNVAEQREVATLKGHSDRVDVVRFSRSGLLLAIGSADGSVDIWDFNSSPDQWSVKEPRHVLRGHSEPVTGLSFSPDGQRLASVSARSLILWDTASGQPVLSPRFQPKQNSRVLFSPNGQQLAVAGGDQVTILDAAPQPSFDLETDRQQALVWHEREAHRAEKGRHWIAAVVHLSRLIEAQPNNWTHHIRRARANASRAHWNAAVADYNRSAELQALNLELLFEQAAVFALAGDRAGYEAICQSLSDRVPERTESFQPPFEFSVASLKKFFERRLSHRDVYLIARTCGLAANPQLPIARLTQLAQEAVNTMPDFAWYQHALGLSHLRAGQFGLAADAFRQSIAAREPGLPSNRADWSSNPLNWLGLSIAYRNLGQPDEALHWRNKALQWFEELHIPRGEAAIPDWHTHDWLAWQLLQRESER